MNGTLTFPSGRTIPLDYVELDAATQKFYYGQLNVTELLTPSQKRQFPGFDVERANREFSDAARIARGKPPVPDPEQAGTLTLFARGVADDLAQLGQTARNLYGVGPENAGKLSPLVLIGGLLALGFVLYQVGAFAWLRKKLTA